MLAFVVGVILLGGSILAFWSLRPRDGVPNPWAVMPVLDTLIPLGLTTGLALGAGLLVSGLVSLF
jgi:hypothetical protein